MLIKKLSCPAAIPAPIGSDDDNWFNRHDKPLVVDRIQLRIRYRANTVCNYNVEENNFKIRLLGCDKPLEVVRLVVSWYTAQIISHIQLSDH